MSSVDVLSAAAPAADSVAMRGAALTLAPVASFGSVATAVAA